MSLQVILVDESIVGLVRAVIFGAWSDNDGALDADAETRIQYFFQDLASIIAMFEDVDHDQYLVMPVRKINE